MCVNSDLKFFSENETNKRITLFAFLLTLQFLDEDQSFVFQMPVKYIGPIPNNLNRSKLYNLGGM